MIMVVMLMMMMSMKLQVMEHLLLDPYTRWYTLNPHNNLIISLRREELRLILRCQWAVALSSVSTTLAAAVHCWEHFKIAAMHRFFLPSSIT